MNRVDLPEVRNVRFEFDAGVPRYWHGGRASVTLFFNNLSVFFPAGERFFIASLKQQSARIQAPELQAAVKAFCGQEAIHSREHLRYNQMLRTQGYPIAAMDQRVEALLARISRTMSARVQLSITCALEHFTAMMAHLLLSDPRLLEAAHPTMAALWRWHAAEENEHKATAYDVYRLTSGTYLERAMVMLVTTVMFWGRVIEQQVRLMRHDGILFSSREWLALIRFLFFDPGGMFQLMRLYAHYYRPSFHPWDLDNRALLEQWKTEFALSRSYGQGV
jgi:hypothetical protein